MKRYLILLMSIFVSLSISAQEELLDLLDDSSDDKDIVLATFKATKIINLQSIEMTEKNELQFIISHRFGTLNSGIYDVFGLDYRKIRLSLDYGILNLTLTI